MIDRRWKRKSEHRLSTSYFIVDGRIENEWKTFKCITRYTWVAYLSKVHVWETLQQLIILIENLSEYNHHYVSLISLLEISIYMWLTDRTGERTNPRHKPVWQLTLVTSAPKTTGHNEPACSNQLIYLPKINSTADRWCFIHLIGSWLLKAEVMSLLCYANGEREVWQITKCGRTTNRGFMQFDWWRVLLNSLILPRFLQRGSRLHHWKSFMAAWNGGTVTLS